MTKFKCMRIDGQRVNNGLVLLRKRKEKFLTPVNDLPSRASSGAIEMFAIALVHLFLPDILNN